MLFHFERFVLVQASKYCTPRVDQLIFATKYKKIEAPFHGYDWTGVFLSKENERISRPWAMHVFLFHHSSKKKTDGRIKSDSESS